MVWIQTQQSIKPYTLKTQYFQVTAHFPLKALVYVNIHHLRHMTLSKPLSCRHLINSGVSVSCLIMSSLHMT